MTRRVLAGSFVAEEDIVGAAREVRRHGFRITDAYTPCPVHGLDEAMGLRPSRLPWVCFVCALFGAAFKLWFQFWAMAASWPMNVGGKPWNSLPAYVPVTFEVMVLLGGLGLVNALFLRCWFYPGKEPTPLFRGATDDTFVLAVEAPQDPGDQNALWHLFREFHAVRVVEREI
jgi:hypothetical protein